MPYANILPEQLRELQGALKIKANNRVEELITQNPYLVNIQLPPHNIFALIFALASGNVFAVNKLINTVDFDYKTPILSMLNQNTEVPRRINFDREKAMPNWYLSLMQMLYGAYNHPTIPVYDQNSEILDIYLAFARQYENLVNDNPAWRTLARYIATKHKNELDNIVDRLPNDSLQRYFLFVPENPEQELYKELLECAFKDRDDKTLSSLLEEYQTLNYQDIPDFISIESTIRYKCFQSTAQLIRMGRQADISIDGAPLLIWALDAHMIDIANELIEKGIQINSEHKEETPLFIAVYEGMYGLAEKLIDKGANIDISDKDNPLLIWVIQKGYEGVATRVIDKMEDINIKYNGETPLSCALTRNMNNLARVLIEKGASLDIVINEMPLMIWALNNNNQYILNLLIEKTIQINAEFDNQTPLSLALVKNMIPVANSLIEKGADTNINIKGIPLVIWVIRNRKTDIAKLVIKSAKEIDIIHEGHTPLFEALLIGNLDLANQLLKRGANIDSVVVVDNQEVNYLIWSVQANRPIVFKWLVNNNAEINKTVNDASPLSVAIGCKKEVLALELCKKGANVNKYLIISALKMNMHILSFIMLDRIELKGNEGHRTTDYLTALDTASIQDNSIKGRAISPYIWTQDDIEEILSTAIDLKRESISYYVCSIIKNKGIKVDSSLLINALENRCEMVALVLIESGVEIDVCDENGNTPLMLAVKNQLFGSIYSLLKMKCDIDAKNNLGKKAADYANNRLKHILMEFSSSSRGLV